MDIWIIYKPNQTVKHFNTTSKAAAHFLGKIVNNYIIIKQERGCNPKVVVPLSHDVLSLEKQIQAT